MNKQEIKAIEDLGKKFELQPHIVEAAKGLFDISTRNKLIESYNLISKERKLKMAACLLIEAKRSPSCPVVSIKEWIKKLEPEMMLGCDESLVDSSYYTKFLSKRFLNIYYYILKNFVFDPPKQCSYDSKPFIDKILSNFEYYKKDGLHPLDKVKLKAKALELLESLKINNLKFGRNPSTVAAICVYGASVLTEQKINQLDIANAVPCTYVTIMNFYSKVKKIWGLDKCEEEDKMKVNEEDMEDEVIS